ncbi:DNA methylase [Saccharomonospora phage PIS 136]|nr:DNA methylase [Saccharomonospora phage PIS 136]
MILDADTTTNLRHDLQNIHTGGPLVVDLFAGPGGWDEGLRATGYTGSIIGVEWDESACATASAAGHPRLRADIAALDPTIFGDVEGLIASPPCQAWSMAGDRKGELDRPEVFSRITAHARNRQPRHVDWHDERSSLTAEPMRWITALRPRWVALEQVPPVLPLWEHTATLLRELGYRAWTGVLSAECYGVPQTRKRAILIARRDGRPVGPPEPTHQPYRHGSGPQTVPDLFGALLPPPVSMSDALGWGLPDRPSWTVTAGGTDTGGAEVFGNAKCRQQLRNVVLAAANQPDQSDSPSWSVRTGNNSRVGGGATVEFERDCAVPSPTLTTNVARWKVGEEGPDGSIRISVTEAGILQGFPADYPWQGTRSAQYRQVGDAVPPPLAAAILRPLVASAEGRTAA